MFFAVASSTDDRTDLCFTETLKLWTAMTCTSHPLKRCLIRVFGLVGRSSTSSEASRRVSWKIKSEKMPQRTKI